MLRTNRMSISVSIARAALESIFDDCDKFDVDETGGRLLGTYQYGADGLEIQVTDVLDAGPQAQRSPTFFLQDGDYQEQLFREIESRRPEIEHLGNWHTHHVNGYPTLSGGDLKTYFRTVNHDQHNTDFFYALLVVRRNHQSGPRYTVRHFLFRRGDDSIYEVPDGNVRILDAPPPPALVRPEPEMSEQAGLASPNPGKLERARDHEFFSDFYPRLKALLSKETGSVYWKGQIALVDGSEASVVAREELTGDEISYSIATSYKNPAVTKISQRYQEQQFRSARQAVVNFERDLNRALYREAKGVSL